MKKKILWSTAIPTAVLLLTTILYFSMAWDFAHSSEGYCADCHISQSAMLEPEITSEENFTTGVTNSLISHGLTGITVEVSRTLVLAPDFYDNIIVITDEGLRVAKGSVSILTSPGRLTISEGKKGEV